MPNILNHNYPGGIKGIIFDCDGVLFDSRESNVIFFNKVLNELNLPPLSKKDEEYVHMASAPESFARLIPAHLHPYVPDAAKRVDYQRNILPLLTPSDGLYDFLEFLNAYGVMMAISTNRSNSVALLLEMFQLTRYFMPVMTTDRAAPKPSPEPLLNVLSDWRVSAADVAFIGDTEADSSAATGAGVPFWAFGNPSLPAQLHVDGFKSLQEIIEDHFVQKGIDLLTIRR